MQFKSTTRKLAGILVVAGMGFGYA